MSAVKQSTVLRLGKYALFAAIGIAALQGCADSQLARFAPPGIVKYEDIASKKPQSPEIVARIEERRSQPDTGKFPVFSETPGKEQRPAKRDPATVATQIEELNQKAEAIKAEVEQERAIAAEETASNLSGEADSLRERVERDNKAAARERREQLKAPAPNDEPN